MGIFESTEKNDFDVRMDGSLLSSQKSKSVIQSEIIPYVHAFTSS